MIGCETASYVYYIASQLDWKGRIKIYGDSWFPGASYLLNQIPDDKRADNVATNLIYENLNPNESEKPNWTLNQETFAAVKAPEATTTG